MVYQKYLAEENWAYSVLLTYILEAKLKPNKIEKPQNNTV